MLGPEAHVAARIVQSRHRSMHGGLSRHASLDAVDEEAGFWSTCMRATRRCLVCKREVGRHLGGTAGAGMLSSASGSELTSFTFSYDGASTSQLTSFTFSDDGELSSRPCSRDVTNRGSDGGSI